MAYTLVPIPELMIAERLETCWGLRTIRITELYLGTGGDTGTFRADAADRRYFLKLAKIVSEPGIAVSLLLKDRGLAAVAPILSSAGNAWEMVLDYKMVVYPLIDGSPIVTEDLLELDWHSIGAALRAVHDAPVPSVLRDSAPSDEMMFTPWGEGFLPLVDAALSSPARRTDPFQKELAKVWLQQGSFVAKFLSMVQAQGQAALATCPVRCLCHNDFQAQNILRSAPGVVHFIDWEGSTWAPPEKDLMFIGPAYRSQFERGYGPLRLNEPVMEYQTSNWLLQDVFDCVDRILFKSNIGAKEKEWALDLTISILPRMKARFSLPETEKNG